MNHTHRLVTLAEPNHLPQSVRDILQGLLMLCRSGLEIRMAQALTECEKQLIRLADKALNEQQDRIFESVQELKRSRADVMPRFLRCVENSLVHLGEDVTQAIQTVDLRSMNLTILLAESAQLNESTVLSDIATKVEMRMREPLYALGQRFGVLAGTPRLAVETMPLGPRSIVDALRFGTSVLNLVPEHRLVLYRSFEHAVLNDAESLYNVFNNYLKEQGILPDKHELLTSGSLSSTAPGTTMHSRPVQRANVVVNPAARFGPLAVAEIPSTVTRAGPADSGRGEKHPGPGRQVDFGTLRQLLGDCRRAEACTASAEDVQSALATLQTRQAAATVADDERLVLYSGERVKQELLVALREQATDGHEPHVDEAVDDTIALIAMLFDYLSRCARPGGITHWILARLQLPILRVALVDKSFFSNRAHAARQLLNHLVELGRYWVDEAEAEAEIDPVLVSKLRHVTNKIGSEYRGRLSVFSEALQDLLQHVDSIMRKIELVESRYVDAARGREKLERARQQSFAEVRERIEMNKPNEFLRMLLEQAWADALTVSLLRDGENGEAYLRRLEVIDKLSAAATNRAHDPTTPATLDLIKEVEAGLGQVGMHDDDVKAILRKLFPDSFGQDENPISQTALALVLRARARLGMAGLPVEQVVAVEKPRELPLKPEEQAALDHVYTLPLGTWFHFVVNQNGDTVRRRLSWYSKHSRRCLFINQRGVPIEEHTLDDLARELASGRTRVTSAEHELLLDQAWSSIVDTLKRFSTRNPESAAQTLEMRRNRFAGRGQLSRQQALRTLLLVDDEENVLRALSRVLHDDGYRILTARNAREGLAVLGQHEVQVVLSDQRMPEMCGTEFLAKVKEAYPDTVRIMLSGYSDAVVITDAINRGVIYQFITKPWNDDDIRLVIQNAFRDFEARQGAPSPVHEVEAEDYGSVLQGSFNPQRSVIRQDQAQSEIEYVLKATAAS